MPALTSIISFSLILMTLGPVTVARAAAPSDLQIFTAADIAECPGIQKTPSAAVDARNLPDDGSVWRVGSNRWSTETENQFSEWVLNQVDESFFVHLNLPTDCADAPVALRVIFARMHHLPVFFQTSPTPLVQSMKRWARLPTVPVWTENNWRQSIKNDPRFLAFLTATAEQIGTENLSASTYPVRLRNPNRPERLSSYVSAGAVLLTPGHTRFISGIDSLGYTPIEQMNSTVPVQVRTLHRGPISMWGLPSLKNQDGVLRFNWVVNCGGKTGFTLVPDERMPGYSEEQYHLGEEFGGRVDLNTFLLRLVPGTRKPYDKNYVDIRLKDLRSTIVNRQSLVNSAQEILARNANAFANQESRIYDDYSTNHRDEGIVKYYDDIRVRLQEAEAAYLEAQAKKFIIQITPTKRTSLYHFVRAVQTDYASPNPASSPEERWGYRYLQFDLDRLLKRKQDIMNLDIPHEKRSLGWIDRMRYQFGYHELQAERELRVVVWDLILVKGLLGNS